MGCLSQKIHMGDVGTVFEVQILQPDDTIYSLEGAQTLTFTFQRPDGTFLTVAGALTTDGTDGKVQYITVAGDLNQEGIWLYQVYIEKDPVIKHTDVSKFRVYPNLIT